MQHKGLGFLNFIKINKNNLKQFPAFRTRSFLKKIKKGAQTDASIGARHLY